MIERPRSGEYAEYYQTYIGQVEGDDVLDVLRGQVETTCDLLASVPADAFRYAPGKWSFREVAAHIADTERLFAFRCLHIARGSDSPLPGMDQDAWVRTSGAEERTLTSLVEELRAVRAASISLFASLPAETHARVGVANGVEFTVRSFPWIVAGHERHHAGLLRQRYLPALEAERG